MDLLGSAPGAVRILIAVAVLGFLVFFHELGHYLAARWRGVHVDAFAIGFGKPLLSWTDRRGTAWRLGWIPLGGYVKLHGMEQPLDVPAEVQAGWHQGRTFHAKPVRDRAIIVAAGPVANFLLAIVLFAGLFAVIGQPVGSTTIGVVAEGSAAAAAGLRPGDEIVSLDGDRMRRFEAVQRHVQPRAGQPIEVLVRRDGEERAIVVTPRAREGSDPPVGVLGIQGGPGRFEALDPASALWAGVVQTVDFSRQTLVGVAEMIAGRRDASELGGPIRILEISSEAASLGLPALINLMALLSISLGLLNLFPIPLLDGGHLVFYALEAIRGRPLPARAQEIGFRAGFALLATLFLFASWNDIAHGGIGRWIVGLVG